MRGALDETDRRRAIQEAYNKEQGITPESVKREVTKTIAPLQEAIKKASKGYNKKQKLSGKELENYKADLEVRMQKAAEALDFEKAIQLREEWLKLG